MAIAPGAPPIVLIASVEEHPLVGALERRRYAVVQVQTGALAVEWARNFQPDAIMLAADLPDMTGIDASRLLHADLRIGHNVPILIIATDKPTPEQRVAALRAGAWDFVRHPGDPEEVALKLQTYVQAKRNIDVAFAEGLIDPATGLHSRPGLARRARELGALMARTHGALACVVFMLESDAHDLRAAGLLLHTARASDVVGALGPGEFAVLAPATDHAGAVKLAHRGTGALHDSLGSGTLLTRGSALKVGYDAVANLTYTPMDPVELLARASAAVRHGNPEPGYAWVRRFNGGVPQAPEGGAAATAGASRATPPGLLLEKRRTSS